MIAWVNSFEFLAAGLDGIAAADRKAEEIIVVTRHPDSEQQKLRDRYPGVLLVSAPQDTTITRLRSIGIKRSTGTVVIVTEDHCVPSKEWLHTVERRMGEGFDMVCGPVENAWDKRLRDSAAFLTEYAFAIRPEGEVQQSSESGPFPGNNAAYRREILEGLCDKLDDDLWESFYLDELRAQGKKLIYDPQMLLFHRRPFDFAYFNSQRYHFCRSFAEMRRKSLSWPGRLKYGVGSAILPPLLWLRGLQTLRRKRRLVGRYFICTPLIAFYLCSGAFGEMMGYLFGGGNSLARVE